MVSMSLKQIEELAMRLPVDDRLALIERLTRSVPSSQLSAQPKDLYGDWRGVFPADFDIDAALREIRDRWHSGEAA